MDARLYAFDLVDGEIHVKFDQPIVVVQYSISGMCYSEDPYLPMPFLGLCLAMLV